MIRGLIPLCAVVASALLGFAAGRRVASPTLFLAALACLLGVALVLTRLVQRARRRCEDTEKAEQEWQAIFNSTRDHIAILDRNFRIVRANSAMAAALRMSPDKIAGRGCCELVHGQPQVPLFCPHAEALRNGKEHSAELQMLGSTFFVTCTPLLDSAGRFSGAVHTARDITALKRVERAAQENAARLAKAQEIAHLGSWELDIVNDVLTWSDEVYRIFGLNPQEFPASYEAFLDAVHPDDRAAVHAAYAGSLKEGRDFYEIEHRVIQKNTGEIHVVHERCEHIRDQAGRIIRSAGMVHDITERKKAEESLNESRRFLRQIFESVYDAILIHSDDGRLIDVNDRFLTMYGLSREELETFSIPQLSAPSAPLDSLPATWAAVLDGRPQLFEWKALRPHDNSEFDVEVYLSPVAFKGERLVMANIRDITDRKQREQELKEADRRKDEFLATLAHELRNPMSTISAAAALLSRMPLPSQALAPREALQRQVKQLGKLVDDLLDVSRVIRGKISLEKENIDLRETVERALEVTKRNIDESRQRLTLKLPDEPLLTLGDPLRLQQIFTNLIANAARYGHEGGEITVTAWRSADYAVVKVQDTGLGIDPAHQKQIFEPFIQINPGISRSRGGLGIGLAVVKRLTELHDGSVHVHSDGIGKGSTFTVSLPLEKTSPASIAGAWTSVRPGLEILVVDDNRDTAVLTAALLEDEGHSAAVAYDGEEAFDLATKRIPDVLLLDIGLPRIDGYEVCRRLRAAGLEATLIVAVSGYGQERDRNMSREAGFDAHLLKPLHYDALTPILAEWQHSDRARRAAAQREEQSPERWQ